MPPPDTEAKPRTISDLADRLGVSSMTIHRAIAGKPDIAPRTRARILAEVERLGWRPNIAARGLRQGKTYTLGILVSNVAASFLPEILQGVDQAAEEQGYHTFVSVHEHDPARAERHLRSLTSKGVDGIVYYPTISGSEGALLNQLLDETPVVTIMRTVPGFSGPRVEVDDRAGGEIAARHLLELGHRTFGFLGYGSNNFVSERREGFEAAIHEAGGCIFPEWVVTDLAPGDRAASLAAAEILSQPQRPSALFCASDRLAAWAMQAAFALGFRVPDDVSIMGYNGEPWSSLLATPLSTIVQPRRNLGECAAKIVLSAPAEMTSRRHEILRPTLAAAASTAPPPAISRHQEWRSCEK